MRKHIQTILAAMMFFAVVFRGPSLPGEIRVWFEVYFEIGLAMGLAAIIWNYNRWIAAFLILTWVFLFFPMYEMHGYLAARAVFNGCLWYLFIIMFFSVHSLNTIYRILRIIVYFHTSVALFQYLGFAGVFQIPYRTGLMANPLELSALLTFCLPAFLVLKGHRRWLILIPVYGIFIAKQFLGLAALGIGTVVYLAMAYRIYWTIIPVVVSGAVWWFFLDAPGIEARMYGWERAIRAWWQHPVLGAGIGHWKLVFKGAMGIDGKRWETTHNEYLQMLFELGIASAVIFIGYYIDVARKMRRDMAIPITALVMISIQCFGTFPMHIAPTAMVAVTWLAITDIQIRHIEIESYTYPEYSGEFRIA